MESLQNLIKTINCPICKSNKYKIIKESNYPNDLTKEKLLQIYRSSSDEYLYDQLVECKKCELKYLNPRVCDEIITQSYTEVEDESFITQNEERIKTFKRSLNYIFKKISWRNVENKKVLDIGCAGGAFPKACSDLGLSPVGVEPSKWLSLKAREAYNLDIRPGTLQDQNFQPEEFDMVTLWDVIEHLTDPNEVLKITNKILKEDGYLIVNYPDYDSLARKILRSKWPFFLSVHLLYFTPRTIEKILTPHGFKVIEVSPYWQTLKLGYVIKRAIMFFPWLRPLITATKFLKLHNVPVRYNVGQSLVIAQKAQGLNV